MKNSIRKNSIKSLIALFAMSLVAVFVFPVFAPANTVVNATTATNSKEVVEWTAGAPTNQNVVYNGNGTISVSNVYDAVQQIKGDAYNPYKNIVKKTIVITNLVSPGGGRHGVSIGIYNSSNSAYGANKYAWSNPRVNIFDSCIQINNGWGDGSSQANTNNRFAYSYNGSAYTLQNNEPYTIYFGIENVDIQGELHVEIYAKVTDVTGQITYVEQTHTLKALNNVPKDFEDTMNVRVRTGARSWTESTDPYCVKEYDASASETYAMDALEHDEDISYFWDWDKKIKNDLELGQRNINDIVIQGPTTLTKDSYLYSPDFDNRMTFKLKVDNSKEYFTSERISYINASGEEKNFTSGALKIGFGQRYHDVEFVIDFYRDTIKVNTCESTLTGSSKAVSYDLDVNKEYKVSLVVRDVRDANGVLKYRLPIMDIAEIGNETHSAQVMALSNDLVEYGNGSGDILPKHLRFTDKNDHNSCSCGCFFTISSIERANWDRSYFLTVEGGQKTALAELVFGDNYDFTAYVDEKAGYEIKALSSVIDGIEIEIPLSGKWSEDIFTKTNGVYSATLVPVYEEIEYDLTYNVGVGANVVSGAPSKITMSDVLDLPEVENIPNGYVLIGWYADSAYTQKIDEITCEGGNVTVYAKVVQGYNFTLELPTGDVIIPMEKNATFDLSSVQVDGYNFTAWQEYNGSSYTNLTNNTVSATSNKTFKPVIEKTSYSITYNMNGGTNPASNKTSYTVDDEFTLETPEKEGYLFVKFVDESGNQVDKIAKGTLGNLTLEAVFVKDEFKATASVYVSTVAQEVPNFVIPETAYYTVAITFGGNALEVEDGKAVFGELGDYTAVYTIVLNGGKQISKTVTITSTKLTLTLDGAYDAQYALNTDLVLLDAFCQKETALVTVKVTKGGQEVEYKNFAIKLTELGVYTVTYTIEGEIADELSTTFEVVQKVANAKTPKTTTASIIDGGSGAGLLIACVGCVIGNRCGKSRDRNSYKNKKEKGEN